MTNVEKALIKRLLGEGDDGYQQTAEEDEMDDNSGDPKTDLDPHFLPDDFPYREGQ